MIILLALSVRADFQFRNEARLPMQWLLDGTVTWYAPRRLALAFTPVLTAVVLAFTVAIPFFSQPRPGQGWLLIPVILIVASISISIHVFHVWMIKKQLDSQRPD